jgi:hypothetical protein
MFSDYTLFDFVQVIFQIKLHLFSLHPESTAKNPPEIRSKYAKKAENNGEEPPENANKGINYVLD